MARVIDDKMLLAAIKQRMLEEIAKKEAISNTINNYAGSGSSGQPGVSGVGSGVADQMIGGSPISKTTPEDDAMLDYLVDIERRNATDAEVNVIGWDKKVHRYAQPKETPPAKKKRTLKPNT